MVHLQCTTIIHRKSVFFYPRWLCVTDAIYRLLATSGIDPFTVSCWCIQTLRLLYERLLYERLLYERLLYERLLYERLLYERLLCK